MKDGETLMLYVRLMMVALLGAVCVLDEGEGEARKMPEDARFPPAVAKQIQDVLAAKFPHKYFAKDPHELQGGPGAAEGYRMLFARIGTDGIRKLQAHVHDGIAIQAAWEDVALTPEREPSRRDRPNLHKLYWFLGFLEGRARVKAPAWWTEALLDSRGNRPSGIMYQPGKLKDRPFHNAGLDDVRAPSDTTLKRKGVEIILRVAKDSVQIPEDLLPKTLQGGVSSNVSALMTPSRCFVAVYEEVGYPYRLACIERSSARVLWESEVWANCWEPALGVYEMWVTVIRQDERVVLFGASTTGIHVEAFRADNGQNLFRFSSSY